MKGLDLSKLQKVGEDDNYTTFRHHYGHEVKVAHKKLSSKMREDLSKIKLAKGGMVKKYADGGDTDDDSSDQSSPPVVINVGGPQQQGGQPQPAVTPTPHPMPAPIQNHGASGSWDAPTTMNTQNPVDNNQQSMASIAEPKKTPSQELDESLQGLDTGKDLPEEQQAPPANKMGVAGNLAKDAEYQQSFDKHFQDHKAEYAQQNAAWEQDLNNGHIQPKTYQSMYGKQDTLGKVGMIFGMLASGAGSGLAHQPNAMMGMLDNVIKNDLDAQVQSKNNALNFLSAQRAQEMNQANVGNIHAQTATATYALAQAKELQSSFHYLTQQTMNMPEGPAKEAKKQMLGIMYNQMGQKINNLNDAAAGAEAFNKTLQGNQTGDPGQNFQNRQTILPMLGPMGENKAKQESARTVDGIPSIAGQIAHRDVDKNDRDQMRKMQEFQDTANDIRNWTKKNSGMLSQGNMAAKNYGMTQLKNLQSKYREQQGMGSLKAFDIPLLDSELPTNPVPLLNSISNDPKIRSAQDSVTRSQNDMYKSYGYHPKQDQNVGNNVGNQQAQAESWARSNPSDPRSAKILKALGK